MRPQIVAMQSALDTASNSLTKGFDTSRGGAEEAVSRASLLQQILAALGLAIGGALAFVIGRGIVRPLHDMTGVMGRLAAGDHDVVVPARDNQDEIGDMARAVEVFKQNAITAERLGAEQATARAARERRQVALEQHTQDFGTSVAGVMGTLAEIIRQNADRRRSHDAGRRHGARRGARDLGRRRQIVAGFDGGGRRGRGTHVQRQ